MPQATTRREHERLLRTYLADQPMNAVARLLQHATFFAGSRRVPPQERNRCFVSAWRVSARGGTYYEGYALSGLVPDVPMHHAWVVTADGQVCDPTWPDGLAYLGVPFTDRRLLVAYLTDAGCALYGRVRALHQAHEARC